MARVHAVREELVGRSDMGPHAQLTGDLAGDGDVIAGDHFDLQALLPRFADCLLGVLPRRIEERQYAEERPRRSVVL
jgi:hypothetical protein